ncbi:MAG: phage holin family protein [Pseudomonadales bacterium]|nr:phage holin family protein [Pseudomonadales bacterium]
MKGFVVRTLICMLGLYLASLLVDGVSIHGLGSFMIAAIFLGFANAIVRPILFIVTLPFTIVTLGLFLFVLNAAVFGLVAGTIDNFVVSGFWPALFGSIVVSITGTIASWYIGPDGKIEVIVRH